MTWRRILFAVDSSLAVGPRALGKLAQVAGALEAEVELFHCAFDWQTVQAGRMGSVRSDEEIREIVEARHQQLDVVAKRLRNAGIRTRVSVRWDHPSYEGIVRQALRQKPDLVVAQSSRHARLSRLMLSHTDYKLIEACPYPLLLLKNDRLYTDPCVIVAAVDPMHAHAKPAALDREIVDSAGAISEALRGTLHVYHACGPWPKSLEELPVNWHIPEVVCAEVCAAHEEKAEAAVKELARRQKVPGSRVHVGWGDAAEQLPMFANSVTAGIVVMGAVSRSRLRRAFLGYTAERVLDALECDVLVIKPPGFRTPVGCQSVHRLPKSRAPRGRYILSPTL